MIMRFAFLSIFLLTGACASTSANNSAEIDEQSIKQVMHEAAPYHGVKEVVAVIPLGLSATAAKRYPYLLNKSVGLGVHNMLMDELYATKRFTFVEDKQSVIENTFKWHELSQSGMVASSAAVQIGRMLSAKKVIYGEVYDYSEGGKEELIGFSSKKTVDIRVGIQMRIVDVETLEVIPASGVGHGLDWGGAAQNALHKAVGTLLLRY